jgi:hypothetical protein
MNDGIVYSDDKTGKLVLGLVWAIEVSFRSDHVTIWGRGVTGQQQDIKECPIDREHVTDLRTTALTLEVFGGDRTADFVPVAEDADILVTAEFAKRLKDSGLSGFKLQPIVKIERNTSRVKHLTLLYLDITGRGGHNLRTKVKGAPNLCPHCAKEIMVCPGCGRFNWPKCRVCDKFALFRPDAPEYSHPDGFRLALDFLKDRPNIVEAKDWDGSDFFRQGGSPFCSTRAKEWMENTGTFPVSFQPALLNIEGVEDRFKIK